MVVGTLERERHTDRLFFALSDATRRNIVTQTLDRDRSVSELGRLYPISLTAVQKHVEVLVDAPTRLVVEDAIVEDDGTPSDGNSMTRMEIDIEAAGDTTRMILTTHFDSPEGMEQAIAMGVVEGMKAWMSQIDALLAEVAA